MEKIAIKYDKDLAKMAKSIFGNIVERAYYTVWDYGSKAETRQRLKNEEQDVSDTIELGHNDIWIKFTSGNMVSFASSEWGHIAPAEIKKSYEVE